MSDSDSDDTLDLVDEAAGRHPIDDGDNTDIEAVEQRRSAQELMTEFKHRELEECLNRFGRAVTVNERATLDGPEKNPKSLSLSREALGPVRDEIKAWMRMNKRPPPPMVFNRHNIGDDNFQEAIDKCDGGLYVPPMSDKDDYAFYSRWAETLEYRWNYDFASLELRRAKQGWKWRLVRIRPGRGGVVVEPFIKPLQRPFRERGKLSSQFDKPRTSAQAMLDKISGESEKRFIGVPVTKREQVDDERELLKMRFIESVREHYGFLGEMVCNAADEMQSSIFVLIAMLASMWLLVFMFGPLSLVPHLSEFVVGLLPLQSSLRGVLAMAKELQMQDLERDVLKDLPKPGDLGGNVRQWLLYWPFYQMTAMLAGWVNIIRPSWYHFVVGCRTAVLFLCASPYFSENFTHEPTRQSQRKRMLIRIWAKRGQGLADAAIFKDEMPERMSSRDMVKKSSPAQGLHRLSAGAPRAKLDRKILEGRLLCGFFEDYYKGSINSGSKGASTLSSQFKKLRSIIVKVQGEKKNIPEATAGMPLSKAHRAKLAELYSEISDQVDSCQAFTRSNDGSKAFADMLRHRYGATDEQIAEYMNARAYELGIVSSNEQGQGRARTYSRDLQRHWHEMLKSVFIKGNIVNQALREIKAPWDPGYVYRPYSINMPDMTADYRAMLHGDLAAKAKLENPTFQNQWNQRLRSIGVTDADIKRSMKPWEIDYVHAKMEDFTEMMPSRDGGRDLGGKPWARDWFEQRPLKSDGYYPDATWGSHAD